MEIPRDTLPFGCNIIYCTNIVYIADKIQLITTHSFYNYLNLPPLPHYTSALFILFHLSMIN